MNLSQQHALATEKANGVLGCTERSDDSRLRNGFLAHYSAVVRSQLEQVYGNVTSTMKELKNLTYEEKLRELGLLSVEKRKLKGILSACTNTC